MVLHCIAGNINKSTGSTSIFNLRSHKNTFSTVTYLVPTAAFHEPTLVIEGLYRPVTHALPANTDGPGLPREPDWVVMTSNHN